MASMPMWVPQFLRQESGEDEDTSPLREFIYLDEVSVVSLLASLTRELTEERTDIDTEESQTKSGWSAKLSFIPFINPGISREKTSIDRDTEEVVRRSEIQSKFDELYSKTAPRFEVDKENTETRISVSEISEGGVMEVDVEFSGHELFHYYKAFQYLIDVAEGAEHEFENKEKQMVELMGSLFGDQIPVVGKLLNYKLVDGEICNSGEVIEEEDAEDLWIAGTLDPDMLWQEPSQFLYEENKFTAYVRVPDAQIQQDWDPLKLTRVIRSISEQIGDQLSSVIEGAFDQAKDEFDTADLEQEGHTSSKYDQYFDFIEDEEDIDISGEQRERLLSSADQEVIVRPDDSSYESKISLLKEIADQVEENEDVELDRERLANYRSELVENQIEDENITSDSSDRKYLEVSFVAVYW